MDRVRFIVQMIPYTIDKLFQGYDRNIIQALEEVFQENITKDGRDHFEKYGNIFRDNGCYGIADRYDCFLCFWYGTVP